MTDTTPATPSPASYLQGLSVLVLGLGDSGLAMARWCALHGAIVRVWDSREAPPQLAALQAEIPDADFTHTPLTDLDLVGVKLVLKSPGLAPGDARIAPLLAQARATGVLVQGELDLFARALADLKAERGYAPRVLAITGTNGKTTTTALTALLVERAGQRVGLAGNIGPTMLDTLREALAKEPWPQAVDEEDALVAPADVPPVEVADEPAEDAAEAQAEPAADDDAPLQLAPPPPKAPVFEVLPEVWVLELSSFQLDGVQAFAPDAGAVLNITQDHLDWHGDMAAYTEAKSRIYGPKVAADATAWPATVMVVNRDDPAVEALVPEPLKLRVAKGRPAKLVPRRVLRFGLERPRRPGDFGLVEENGMAWLVRALDADETVKRKKDEEEEIHLQRLMPADALRIRGRHNAANVLAALALATAIGCPLAPMLHGLREYTGEPHRVEYVATVNDIEAFDDSKGTNVGATVAALTGLGADKHPAKLVVILGGDGKGQDFTSLAEPVARHVRAVALIGRDADAIAQALAATGVPMQRHDSLEAAVPWCFEQARAGDAVLLSPACASLDMFRNYAHRAEVFVAAVQALANDAGEAGVFG